MMKMQYISRISMVIFLLVTLALTNNVYSGNYDFRRIDNEVKYYTGDYLPLDIVATELATLGRNDLEKARAIYMWISMHIEYDYSFTNYYAEETFRDRKGVCNGYATLFKAMGDAAGLETKIVSGYAKGTGYQQRKRVPESNHAWNAIKLSGKWYHIETTWASCVKEYDYYFLTAPEQFIFTHLPLDGTYNRQTRSWDYSLNANEQLLSQPIDYQTWDMLPNVYARDMASNPAYYTLSNFREMNSSGLVAHNKNINEDNYNKTKLTDRNEVTNKNEHIRVEAESKSSSRTRSSDTRQEKDVEIGPVLNEESMEFLELFKAYLDSEEFRALQKNMEIKTEEAFTKFKTYYDSGEMQSDIDAFTGKVQSWWQSESVQSFKEESKKATRSALQSLINWLDE